MQGKRGRTGKENEPKGTGTGGDGRGMGMPRGRLDRERRPRALDIGVRLGYNETCVNAAMAELADAMDLGSIGRPCRFESC